MLVDYATDIRLEQMVKHHMKDNDAEHRKSNWYSLESKYMSCLLMMDTMVKLMSDGMMV